MRDTILNFCGQFKYEPEIINPDKLGRFNKFIIAGMGGSNLVADLLKIRAPEIDIIAHRNYGLPTVPDLSQRLLIANSYSGNTEETIDSLNHAFKKSVPATVVATGGKLIELAKKHGLPYIQMPATGIQPRSALGFNIKAIAKLIGRNDFIEELNEIHKILHPEEYEKQGKTLAKKLKGYIPVIYSSVENSGIAYNWKIKFNETGKIPAFYNVFSELNHNEMTGFNVQKSTAGLSKNFHFIFLKDPADHPKIQKRMEITAKLYTDRELPVEILELRGKGIFHKIFSSLVLADWTSYYTAEQYGVEPEQVPIVEEFKKLIA
ncbi:bifunctional phosphoglucose/phosphomannose isomerase [Candidatus Wolfebacteria bacterium RIFCSPLOWO2_01_FULL_45_19]|uniref:Bifunctional phosphoglucose/phosphomannose isomerase n=1 Tax=Candidatus Wolfebacteria bacterium RIFCSPLOWO2_01_FULL_45_19 TaxID=1802557 RepID=A0A1F8DSP2_9BACT|nr:MAG: bifunctional phosphoglucose/phosphomannose isomerase [Candidatus Wolfebacteria bacterium RIFCSPLOWO2_01_FULL_45_19]